MWSSQLLFYYNVILPNEVMRLRKICPCIPLQNRATLNDPDFEDSLSFSFFTFTVVYRALWGFSFINRYVSISRNIRILFHRLFSLVDRALWGFSFIDYNFSISRTLRILFHRLLFLIYRALWGFSFIDCHVSMSRTVRNIFHRLLR